MPEQEPEERGAGGSFDQIAEDLRQLRLDAGEVSYAEIVRRIAKHREAGGVAPAAARPARTTIYDAFRTGRSRINAELVGEIARALGADEGEVAQWERRCILARRESEHARTAEPPAPNTDEPLATVPTAPRAGWWVHHATLARILLAVACLGINFTGSCAVEFFKLSLYLDAIGTGLAAIVLGPWWGVAVGVSTNLLGYTVHGTMALPFALQSAALALVWGYGARRFQMTQTLGKYFRLNVFAGISHSIVAVPILLAVFGGGTGHAGDVVFQRLNSLGIPLSLSVGMSNIVLALADSLLAGFIIMVLVGFIKTKPPFPDDCAQLFPFYDPPSASRAIARVVAVVAGDHRPLPVGAWRTAASDRLGAVRRFAHFPGSPFWRPPRGATPSFGARTSS